MERDDLYVLKHKNGVLGIATFSVLSYNRVGQTATLLTHVVFVYSHVM